jgi:hypothetical protein
MNRRWLPATYRDVGFALGEIEGAPLHNEFDCDPIKLARCPHAFLS